MSIQDERDLRTRLGGALGAFEPSPFPHDAVVRKGRTTVIRRRLTALASAAAVVVAGVAAPVLLRAASAPPSAARHYHVTVHQRGPGSVRGLVASGLVNRAHWQLTVREVRGDGLCIASIPGTSSCGGAAVPPAGRHLTAPAVLSADPSEAATLPGGRRVRVQMLYGYVRPDVDRVAVQLSNGQVLMLHPAAVFGRRYASWVALAFPFAAAVREVIAYSGARELGYSVPFTGAGYPEFIRWLPPGRAPLPSPVTVRLGSGHAAGRAWHASAHLGPWGICFTGGPVPMDLCWPRISVLKPGQQAALVATAHETPLGLAAVQAARAVSYLIVTTRGGATFRVTPVRVGAWKYCAVPSADRDPDVTWTAYDASGTPLGTGSARAW